MAGRISSTLDYLSWLLEEHPTTLIVLMALYAFATDRLMTTIVLLQAGVLNELVLIRGEQKNG